MFKFVFLTVCALACLTQATPAKLSKEFGSAQEIERQETYDLALEEFQNYDFLGTFVKLVLKTPERAVANVNEVLVRNSNAGAEEVLEAFNAGLNARIFVINGDYIEIDQAAFGRMVFENTRGFAQLFYPSLQQRSADNMYQRKLQEYTSAIELKQPLEQFTAILAAESRQIDVKAFSLGSIVTAITSSISSIVSSIVGGVASLIVNLLTAIVTLVNNVLAFLKSNVSFLFALLNPIGQIINGILQSIINPIKSLITSLTSRKRRDVSEVVDVKLVGVISTIGTLLNNIAGAIVSIVKELLNDVKNVLTTLLNVVFGAIASVGSALSSLLGLLGGK